MRLDLGGTPYSKRSLARAAIAALGLAALIGSGGGSAPECSFFSNSCNIGPIVFPPIPYARIEPERVTVQVGATAVFNARSGSVVQPSYRWCRTPAGATVCTEIAGATGASYTALILAS